MTPSEVIVDQGILLEYYLDDTYAAACERLLEDLTDGTLDGYLSDFHLHGTIAVFDTYFKTDAPDEIQDLLFGVMAASGIVVYRLSPGDVTGICEIQRNSVLDFDDATLVCLADALDVGTVVTLDGDLDDYAGGVEFEALHPADY